MARSDLLLKLIKAGSNGDLMLFEKTVEALASEERAKQHDILADKLLETFLHSKQNKAENSKVVSLTNYQYDKNLFWELVPDISFEDLILEEKLEKICSDFIEEHNRVDLLASYGIEPRNRVLLAGPPGNGKTSLAEAIAESLSIPLIVVRYETLIGSYLGETSSRLKEVFDYCKSRKCVLFFDEFDTIGKERGDKHETGEIKRVVSSLLLQIDKLPSHVIVITASNHPELLDKAVWRRFQLRLQLNRPSKKDITKYLKKYANNIKNIKFPVNTIATTLIGASFSDINEVCTNITRKYILSFEQENIDNIVDDVLSEWKNQFSINSGKIGEDSE